MRFLSLKCFRTKISSGGVHVERLTVTPESICEKSAFLKIYLEQIKIWIDFSERLIKKIPKSDEIWFWVSLNQKLQKGGISKSSVPLVRVGHIQTFIKVFWNSKGFNVQNFSEKVCFSQFFEMLPFGNSSVVPGRVPDLKWVPIVLGLKLIK